MIDNDSTDPEIILARRRAGTNQATLNVELALGGQSSGNSSNASGSAGGGAIGASGFVPGTTGGTIRLPKDEPEIVE